jgi:5-methylcytosine-specific restriction enzyme subunit McrC
MSIPIRNLYYLLTYAWDQRLDQSGMREVDAAACPNLNSLFARVLAHGVQHLLRRGMDRSYVLYQELTSRIRGRIDFALNARRQTWKEGKLECTYDELSHDVLHNRILKSSLLLLHHDPAVEKETRTTIARLIPSFSSVSAIDLHLSHFRRIQLHRNNRIYHFLLELCELIHRSYLPDRAVAGHHRFRDIQSDEKIMSAIFEKFVRNFAARHLEEASVSAMHVKWDAEAADTAAIDLLPVMKTDLTIERPGRKLILDCKYYREALKGNFDRQAFISGNLYQLHAYLANKSAHLGWEQASGMLLYPTNGIHLDHRFTLRGKHDIRIVTLDLNREWPQIHAQLLDLLDW